MQFRIYVGRCTKDHTEEVLREYFSQYGVVTEVYIPHPFKACAFITFQEARVAKSLIDEEHVIEGVTVHTSTADAVKRHQPQAPYDQPSSQGYQPWGSRAGAPSFGATSRPELSRGMGAAASRPSSSSYKSSVPSHSAYNDEESNPIANLPPDMFSAIASAVISEVRKTGME
jgi:RNA recognition motif-containing protein